MTARRIVATMKAFFGRLFHKRNVIIVSEHKVKHMHVSAATQLAVLVATAGLMMAGTYYAGLTAASKVRPAETASAPKVAKQAASTSPNTSADKNQLISRVAYLEQQVSELEISKQNIIDRVQQKTSGQIDKLERIIKQTGLNPDTLRAKHEEKHNQSKHSSTKKDAPVGGPYIPDQLNTNHTEQEKALYAQLDELGTMRDIVHNLPLALPMKNARMHSHYGRRIDPFSRRPAFHSGLDMAGRPGAPILATANGRVTEAKRSSSYGYYVDIDHGYDVTTRYAHLSKILVRKGQKVKLGDAIGKQGSTGRSTGQHLHYEVRYRGQALNPRNFIRAGKHVLEK